MAEGIFSNLPTEQDDQDSDISELIAASGLLSGEPVPEPEAIDTSVLVDGDASVLEDTDASAVEAIDTSVLEDTGAPVSEDTDASVSEDGDTSVSEDAGVSVSEDVPAAGDKATDDRKWFVVHCYSGYENKVKRNLEQRISSMDMEGFIFQVVVPTEEEIEVRDGKRRTYQRRVFPGYILVEMVLDDDSWYVVRNTPGVTGFVGMGNKPTPLRDEEVQRIIKRMEADAPKVKVTFKPGQKVRIIQGPFADFIGTVEDINMEKGKVRVMVSFFGRETPVELDFLQVEKV